MLRQRRGWGRVDLADFHFCFFPNRLAPPRPFNMAFCKRDLEKKSVSDAKT